MKQRAWLILFFTAIVFSAVHAQQRTIAGKVVADKTNTPIEFASVQVKDHELWAFTDQQGLFTIKNVPSGTLTIVVQCLGYITKNVVLKDGQTTYTITM